MCHGKPRVSSCLHPFVDTRVKTPEPAAEKEDSVKRDPANDSDSISFQLQSARVDAGLSIADLSKQTGISKTVLHGYERARTKPGAREIRLLCAALKVSPNRLLFGADEFDVEPSEFTSFYRKVRARPELAAMFYVMCLPLMASLLDEEEVKSLLYIVAGLMRARNPNTSDLLMAAAKEAMTSLDSVTVADGSLKISEEELQDLVAVTQKRMEDRLKESTTDS